MSSDPTTLAAATEARARHVEKSGRLFEQVKEGFKSIAGAIAIALVFRSFVFEPFNIPSGSMLPNLLVGDYLLVAKWPYGYSRYSLPMGLPLWEGRVAATGEPARGDVVVFKNPTDNRTDFIKRLIGLPGDQIQVQGGQLFINGTAVPKTRLPDVIVPITRADAEEGCRARFDLTVRVPLADGGFGCRYRQYREVLPGGRAYVVLDQASDAPLADNTGVFLVPEGHYFMMGDNRDDSADSRFPAVPSGGVGFVPAENLVGRATVMFFSIDGTAHWYAPWTWPGAIRVSRLGTLF